MMVEFFFLHDRNYNFWLFERILCLHKKFKVNIFKEMYIVFMYYFLEYILIFIFALI